MDAAVSVTTVRKKHRRIGAGTVVIYLVLIFWAVLTIFPFVWVVLNSFKPSAEVLRSSFSLPETFTWMNYQTAFERLNVLRAYRYSFVISGTVTVGVMVFASLRAVGFMQSIPLEMEEAAYMEGADVFKVFGKIIVPLCRPSLATVAIFSFLWSYNDLFVQKIMMRDPTRYPISTLLEQISSQYGTDFGLMAASVTIIVIPVMIVYVLLQKNIIKGLTAGAVKG